MAIGLFLGDGWWSSEAFCGEGIKGLQCGLKVGLLEEEVWCEALVFWIFGWSGWWEQRRLRLGLALKKMEMKDMVLWWGSLLSQCKTTKGQWVRKRKLWLALIGMLSVVAVAELGGNGDFTVRRWVFGDFGGTVMVEEWTQDYGGLFFGQYFEVCS